MSNAEAILAQASANAAPPQAVAPAKNGAAVVYVVAVLAFLLVGAVQTLFPIWTFAPLEERRNPTPIGDYLHGLARHDESLPASLNAWFDDRFGFRNLLVRVYNEMQYRVFNVSRLDYIGRDGFLFYKDILGQEIDESRADVDAKEQMILGNLHDLSAYLAARNIKLVIAPIPAKDMFYADLLPASAPRTPPRYIPDEINARLQADSAWLYVDVAGAMHDYDRAKTAPGPLYYRLDPHENFWGALAAGTAIARTIAADAGMPVPTWRAFHNFRELVYPGNTEQRFMGLFQPLMERLVLPSDSGQIGLDTDLGYWAKDEKFNGIEALNLSSIYEYAYHTRDGHLADRLPAIVIYGDSFGDHLVPAAFQEEFAAVYRSRINQAHPFMDVLRQIPSGVRYFVLVLNEGGIVGLKTKFFHADPAP